MYFNMLIPYTWKLDNSQIYFVLCSKFVPLWILGDFLVCNFSIMNIETNMFVLWEVKIQRMSSKGTKHLLSWNICLNMSHLHFRWRKMKFLSIWLLLKCKLFTFITPASIRCLKVLFLSLYIKNHQMSLFLGLDNDLFQDSYENWGLG